MNLNTIKNYFKDEHDKTGKNYGFCNSDYDFMANVAYKLIKSIDAKKQKHPVHEKGDPDTPQPTKSHKSRKNKKQTGQKQK